MNPQNKCAQLFSQPIKHLPTIEEMFDLQKQLQAYVAARGKGLNYDSATFKEKVDQLTKEWRNLTCEFSELLERLPFKEWKTYTQEQLMGFESEEQKLETWYEYIDMFHFFMNIGLLLGIDGETFKKLYTTKNQENFDRQNRGY